MNKMKRITMVALAAIATGLAACSTLRKHKDRPGAEDLAPTPPAPAKNTSGVFAPGVNELTAITGKYKDVTMQTLNEGHGLYTGVCTNCHQAVNIYTVPEEKWPEILNDMAPKAMINERQKDAVYKYVLAIKATQPK